MKVVHRYFPSVDKFCSEHFWCEFPDTFFQRFSVHQAVKVFIRQVPDFLRRARPTEGSVGNPFVEQKKSVFFICEAFDPVAPSAAEQIQRVRSKRVQPEFLTNQGGQTVNAKLKGNTTDGSGRTVR